MPSSPRAGYFSGTGIRWTYIDKVFLVGGLEHGWIMTFHILEILIPTDELIFFRGVGIPPSR
jgi:hypothetical protein